MYLRIIFLTIAIAISSSFLTEAQEIWEAFSKYKSPWDISSKLTTITNNSDKVEIENQIYQSEEDKRNKVFSCETVWISSLDYPIPIDISFAIENIIPTYQGNRYYSKNHWYWKISIQYTTSTGLDKYYDLVYGSFKYESKYGTYQESCTSDNGTQSAWVSADFMQHRHFRVLFDGDELKIYNDNGENLAKTITGVKKVRFISVGAGPGTHLAITNTSYLKMTTYGQALPYLTKAVEYIKNEQYNYAATEMTTAIEKGLECYEVYLTRGCAYYFQGYYKSAIADLKTVTVGLRFGSENNRETAWYYLGLSKLKLNDDSGIECLKRGGQEGLVFLIENDLLDYTPGQNKKNHSQRRNNKSSQQKKPALTK